MQTSPDTYWGRLGGMNRPPLSKQEDSRESEFDSEQERDRASTALHPVEWRSKGPRVDGENWGSRTLTKATSAVASKSLGR
jgi:hypothetical protein